MYGGGGRGGGGGQGMQQYKPRAALHRAHTLKKIGHMRDACEYLFEVLTSKRMGRFFTSDHEDMMMEFISLCTDLRETRRTKEGLYFYRQLTQIQAPASLEKVVAFMITSAEKRAAEARARAEMDIAKATKAAGGAGAGAAAGVSGIDDLDEEEQSPEALLMGGVTSEGARERTEREVLAPWLRHARDIYRNVLDNIRWVPRLEPVYHTVVVRAMRFCRDYATPQEFRKLIGMVRNHLSAQRRSQEANGVSMTPEQIERHLATRFVQLELCTEMSLWAEAYKTVGDINGIMALAEAPVKTSQRATYYEKLARIFWVSQNYLFHAFAWYRFYSISIAANRSLTDADRTTLASAVVLAALAIPVQAAGAGGGLYGSASALSATAASAGVDVESSERAKKAELTALLLQNSIPSREGLMTEIRAGGLLRKCRPDVAELFRVLEGEFAPLTLVARVKDTLAALRGDTGATVLTYGSGVASHALAQYVPHIERLAVLRTLQQLSAVYSTLELASLRRLLAGLSLPFYEIEAFIVRAVRSRLLSVRLDHRSGCVRLGNDALEAGSVRRSLTELAARLQAIVDGALPAKEGAAAGGAGAAAAGASVAARMRSPDAAKTDRQRLFDLARAAAGRDPLLARKRFKELEQREAAAKEEAIRTALEADRLKRQLAAERLEEEERLKAVRAAEAERQRQEAAVVEAARKAEEEKLRNDMTTLGLDTAVLAGPYDAAAIKALIRDADKRKRETEHRVRAEQARKADVIVRAIREEERGGVREEWERKLAAAEAAAQLAAKEAASGDAVAKARAKVAADALAAVKATQPPPAVRARDAPTWAAAQAARLAAEQAHIDAVNGEEESKARARFEAAAAAKPHLARVRAYMAEYEARQMDKRRAAFEAKKRALVLAAREEFLRHKVRRAREQKVRMDREKAEADRQAELRKQAEEAANRARPPRAPLGGGAGGGGADGPGSFRRDLPPGGGAAGGAGEGPSRADASSMWRRDMTQPGPAPGSSRFSTDPGPSRWPRGAGDAAGSAAAPAPSGAAAPAPGSYVPPHLKRGLGAGAAPGGDASGSGSGEGGERLWRDRLGGGAASGSGSGWGRK